MTNVQRPPFYLASSCYSLLTARGDREKWIKSIAANGATSTRFFIETTWGNSLDNPFQFFKVVGYWPKSVYGVDGCPVFDCNEPNMAFWKEFRKMCKLIHDNIGHAHVVLFDHCSRKYDGWKKLYNPFYSNVQRYPNFAKAKTSNDLEKASISGGIMGAGMMPYHKEVASRAVSILRSIGIGWFDIETVNEYDTWNWDQLKPGYGYAWHKKLTDHLTKTLKVPKQYLVYSGGKYVDKIANDVGLLARHGVSNASELPDQTQYWPSRIIISGDGAYNGHGVADYKGRRCWSAAEGRDIILAARKRGYTHVEYFDFGTEKQGGLNTLSGCWGNVDLFNKAPLIAMAKALK
jgi:hypothetical protein